MRLSIKKMSIMNLLFSIVILSMVLFAFDKYNIKIVLFIILIFFNINTILNCFRDVKKYFMIIYMMVVYPFITIFFSTVMSGGDITSAIRAVYINFFLLIVFIAIKNKNINVYECLYKALSVEVLIILFIAAMDFLRIIDLYENPVTQIILDMNEGQISKSIYALFYYVIFINSSPLLLFHFTYSLFNRKYIWVILSFLAIMFTGTRANIYIAIVTIPVYLFFIIKSKTKKAILLTVCCVIAISFFDIAYEKIALINYAKASGDLIRDKTVDSIFNVMKENPLSWIFGMGFGTSYYSAGRDAWVSTSELSYLEMLRTVGLVGTIAFIYFLVYPIKKIYFSCQRWILLPYGALLVSSIIDPFLYTSTSFVLYTVIYYTYYSIYDKK